MPQGVQRLDPLTADDASYAARERIAAAEASKLLLDGSVAGSAGGGASRLVDLPKLWRRMHNAAAAERSSYIRRSTSNAKVVEAQQHETHNSQRHVQLHASTLAAADPPPRVTPIDDKWLEARADHAAPPLVRQQTAPQARHLHLR